MLFSPNMVICLEVHLPVKSKLKASPPPKPEARKSLEINVEYEKRAKDLLRAMLKETENDYEALAEKLNAMGIEISARGLENKISRGGFSAAFLLQCREALNLPPLA
ncbi:MULTISPECIES: DUF6471 domain-containing protein [unclassified Hyphomonas]|uniref:DUF6471 domain-containing protein n=1 Tax=unclassified Hyphomonas TaxID=2630699 RepID=UPI001F29076C|nr:MULTISPECIES: DUF6471 domain-containing protein [unclassified Hyphomonas]